MSNHNSSGSQTLSEEVKESSSKYSLSKFDHDLYNDDDNIVEKLIRVKRFSLPNKGDKWKIFENDKVVLVIEGTALTGKERDFLKTVSGITFLIAQHKKGIKSIPCLKADIKKCIAEG
jgi:hypothetical protein